MSTPPQEDVMTIHPIFDQCVAILVKICQVLVVACRVWLSPKFLMQVHQEKYIHPYIHSYAIYPTIIHPSPSFLRKYLANEPNTYAK